MREDRKKRNRRSRQGAGTAAAAGGQNAAMTLENGTLLIRVPEELDHHSAAQISAQADEMIRRQDVREVVFDFSGTMFCDSSGIGMLMGRYKIMQALGGSVRAVKVQDRVERILLLSGVMKVIPVERV